MIAKPKHQRLVLVVIALVAVLAAVLLAMWGLRDRAAYFYTPADVVAGKARPGQSIRLGGMVQRGSVQRLADGVTVRFVLTDGAAKVPVVFRGIVPDLFREGSGAIAEGSLEPGGTFEATNILAKHDERYMPPQMGNQAAEHQTAKTVAK
jgi:cytochrome c-type biogenesis protein CcmE